MKRLCAWLNIFSFFIRSQTKQRYSCIVFLCASSSSFLSSPALPPEDEEEAPGPVRKPRRRGLCGPGLKQRGTAEVHVHKPSGGNPPIHSQLGGEGDTSPNKKGQKDNIEKQETQRPSLSPSPPLACACHGTRGGRQE